MQAESNAEANIDLKLDESRLTSNGPQSIKESGSENVDDADEFTSRFELLQEIGRGSTSVIYTANEKLLKRKVAVKIFHAQTNSAKFNKEHFIREAQSAASLKHPAIVQLYSFGWKNSDSPYVAMELITGSSLNHFLAEHGTINIEQFERLFLPLLDGLAYAHSKKIIHRDIRPANMMLCNPDDTNTECPLKLLDFGLAKVVEEKNEKSLEIDKTSAPVSEQNELDKASTLTQWDYAETLYQSPEQRNGIRADLQSDIYSIAAVMYHCITGHAPLPDPLSGGADPKMLTTELTKLNFPKRLIQEITRALSIEAKNRPQSAAEFHHNLKEALKNQNQLLPAHKRILVAIALLSFTLISTLLVIAIQSLKEQEQQKQQSTKQDLARFSKAPTISPDKQFNEINILIAQHQHGKALQLLLKMKINPLDKSTTAMQQEKLGQCYEKLNDLPRQVEAQKKMFALRPAKKRVKMPILMHSLAVAMIKLGEEDEAKALYKQCIAETERDAEVALGHNLADFHAGYALCFPNPPTESMDYANKALQNYERIHKRSSLYSSYASIAFARAAKKMGKKKEVTSELQKCLAAAYLAREKPDEYGWPDPEAVARLAIGLKELGFRSEAIEMYKLALEEWKDQEMNNQIANEDGTKQNAQKLQNEVRADLNELLKRKCK